MAWPKPMVAGSLEPENLCHLKDPKRASDPSGDAGLSRAELADLGAYQVDPMAAVDDLAAARREDVLHPIDVRAVRERYQEPPPGLEDVDRGPVETAGPTAPMQHDPEAGEPACHRLEDGVGHATVQAGQPTWKGHDASVRRAACRAYVTRRSSPDGSGTSDVA
jgi:hypothetical protein